MRIAIEFDDPIKVLYETLCMNNEQHMPQLLLSIEHWI